MAAKKRAKSVLPLKKRLNPKNRGNIVAPGKFDAEALSPREKELLRIINALEEQLDEISEKAAGS